MKNLIIKILVIFTLTLFNFMLGYSQTVTCPTSTDLGTYDCNSIDSAPQQANSVSDVMAVYGIEITDALSETSVTTIDSDVVFYCEANARKVTREVIVYNDLDFNYEYTPGEEVTNGICTFTISTNPDITPPTISSPPDFSTTCTLGADPSITGFPVFWFDESCNNYTSDNVDWSDAPPAIGSCAGERIIVRSWTATDACGNISSPQTQVITILDQTGPTFTIPPDTIVPCGSDLNDPAVTGNATDVIDECDQSIILVNGVIVPDLFQEDTPKPGSTTYIKRWGAVDDCGNATTQDQTIIVECFPDFLCENLTACYSFDESYVDLSGNENDGAIVTTSSTPNFSIDRNGMLNKALEFTEFPQLIELPKNILNCEDCTQSFWIKTTAENGTILSANKEDFKNLYTIGLKDNKLGISLNLNDDAENFLYTDRLVNDGEWHHIVIVIIEKLENINNPFSEYIKEIEIYINETKQDILPVSTIAAEISQLISPENEIYLGNTPGVNNTYLLPTNQFIGSIDELQFYDKALTFDEIKSIEDCNTIGPLEPDCKGNCGGNALPGSLCDDRDPDTINDFYDDDCICVGTCEYDNNAGQMGTALKTVCAEESVNAPAEGVIVSSGNVHVYLLHDGTGTIIYALNSTGTFENDGSYPTNVQLSISSAVGPPNPDGIPDLSVTCSDDVLPGCPVIFYDPISINHYVDCNETLTVNFSITGGGPSVTGGTYSATGTYSGIVSPGQQYTIVGIPDGTTYSITIVNDGKGCTASVNGNPVELCENDCGAGASPGDPCDDGDPRTIDDIYYSNCNCIGTTMDDLCPTIDDLEEGVCYISELNDLKDNQEGTNDNIRNDYASQYYCIAKTTCEEYDTNGEDGWASADFIAYVWQSFESRNDGPLYDNDAPDFIPVIGGFNLDIICAQLENRGLPKKIEEYLCFTFEGVFDHYLTEMLPVFFSFCENCPAANIDNWDNSHNEFLDEAVVPCFVSDIVNMPEFLGCVTGETTKFLATLLRELAQSACQGYTNYEEVVSSFLNEFLVGNYCCVADQSFVSPCEVFEATKVGAEVIVEVGGGLIDFFIPGLKTNRTDENSNDPTIIGFIDLHPNFYKVNNNVLTITASPFAFADISPIYNVFIMEIEDNDTTVSLVKQIIITDKDTDGDLLGDTYETNIGLDPNTPNTNLTDQDNDGLDDFLEAVIGSNPLDNDTDDDGFSDSIEFRNIKDFNNPTNFPEMPDTPACDDGIQNGNEEGIDCGGSCSNNCVDVSVNDVQNTKDFSIEAIIPMPVYQYFDLLINSNKAEMVSVEIHNSIGQMLYKQSYHLKSQLNKLSIDVSDLPSGIHLLSVKSGNSIVTSKIIKY